MCKHRIHPLHPVGFELCWLMQALDLHANVSPQLAKFTSSRWTYTSFPQRCLINALERVEYASERWEEPLSGSVAVGSAELIVTAAINERVLGNHSVSYMKNSKNILLIGIMKVNLLISQSGRELSFTVSSYRDSQLGSVCWYKIHR